jgi:AcrR family transcriptional regulator
MVKNTPKPKKRRSRSKADKDKQKNKIIQGSLELIRDRGFHGFGMRALAKHIGMSQGNLYNYMASQRELWIAIRIHIMHEFKLKMEEIAFSSNKKTVDTLIDIGEYV